MDRRWYPATISALLIGCYGVPNNTSDAGANGGDAGSYATGTSTGTRTATSIDAGTPSPTSTRSITDTRTISQTLTKYGPSVTRTSTNTVSNTG